MLIAAMRTGHALAGKAVTYNDEDGRFRLTGAGEISPATLIAYDESRALDWADDVTREWALEMAAILVRKQAAEDQRQAEAAAAAAAEAARLEALAPPSVVYPPPDTSPPRPEGIPAVAPGFQLAAAALDRQPRWVVWAEAAQASDEASAQAAAPAPPPSGGSPPAGSPPPTPASDRTAGPTSSPAPRPVQTPQAAPDGSPALPPPGRAAPPVVAERDRRARRGNARRARGSGTGLRVALYLLVAVVAAAVLLLVQRGGL